LWGADGEPAPGWATRLAVATAVVLPTSVILLEQAREMDEAFTQRVVERVRERLRSGTSLVLASRKPELVRTLCDEVILLEAGSIIDRGGAKGVARRYEAASTPEGRTRKLAPSHHLSQGQKLHVPPVVPAFNASAALLSARVHTAAGRPKRIDAAADELSVEIGFATALPDIEAHCGVAFTPRTGDRTGTRLELPEPLRFVDPGTYLLVARVLPGTLRSGIYDVRADAVVANPGERGASVIARDIGRVRIVGDELDVAEPVEPPVAHWDGRVSWLAAAEWSIEH
jgi:hypothetical protein